MVSVIYVNNSNYAECCGRVSGAATFSLTTLSLSTLSLMTLSIEWLYVTHSISTFSIKCLYVTLSDSQHERQSALKHFIRGFFHDYAKSRVMLSVILLSVIMLSVVAPK